MYSNHQDSLETNSPYAPPSYTNPSGQYVTTQMATGGEWGHSHHQPLSPQSQQHQQRGVTPAQPQYLPPQSQQHQQRRAAPTQHQPLPPQSQHHQQRRVTPTQPQPLPPQSQQHQQRRATPAQHQPLPPQFQVPEKEAPGYRFGDLTRSIVAEGKKNSGRKEKDGYKFGDFTRGLFK
jgi:hypothetical protein